MVYKCEDSYTHCLKVFCERCGVWSTYGLLKAQCGVLSYSIDRYMGGIAIRGLCSGIRLDLNSLLILSLLCSLSEQIGININLQIKLNYHIFLTEPANLG